MKALHAARSIWIIFGGAVLLAALACLLPENVYQRWQLMDGTIQGGARWIYERSNFDPTPIDVALVGSSRVAIGIDAPRLQRDLAAAGREANVVNFAMPEAGRDMNYAIVQQLMANKAPKLLIIGVTEKPSRLGHPAFKYIAPPSLIVDPAYPANAHYLGDLIYLPFRQMRLFVADVLPGGTGLTKTFDPSQYKGPSVDMGGYVLLPDGTIKDNVHPASAAELARGVRKLEAGMTPPILPARYADVEFGDERIYIRRIIALARAKGARVAFLFQPYYTGPTAVQEQAFYSQFGPVWNAGFLASHAEWFSDYAHADEAGSGVITDWVAARVADLLGRPKG